MSITNNANGRQAKQTGLDLFPEPDAPAAPTRRIIAGRIKFFPRQSKPAAAPEDDPVPFDDPIGF